MAVAKIEAISENMFNNQNSENLTEGKKIYVLVVIYRLSRILNWEPGDDESLLDKEMGPSILRDIMIHFEHWKSFVSLTHDSSDLKKLQYYIITDTAKLCFYYSIQDSSIVANIMRQIYACNDHFSYMYSHLSNRNVIRGAGSLWRPELSDYAEEYIAYFLYHAHKAKVLFCRTRFVDLQLRTRVTPLYLAVIYHKPRLLLHLLRYGAKSMFNPIGRSGDWNFMLKHMMDTLWITFRGKMNSTRDEDPDLTTMSKQTHDIALCFCLMLRVITQLRGEELDFYLANYEHGAVTGLTKGHDFITWISTKGIVPKLASRYRQPSELIHLCRCVVRKSLNDNWNLPFGILDLPLPKRVMHYVDILED